MVKPFSEQGHYTEFHNVALDIIMPKVSGNAWKILCLIIRKTKGFRKESDKLSYSQLRKGTGIVSNTTVQEAINELLAGKYILAIPGEGRFDPTSYSLNRDLEIELPSVTETVTRKKPVTKTVVVTETVTVPTTETVTVPTTETVKTKEIQRNKEINMAHSRPSPVTIPLRDKYRELLKAVENKTPPKNEQGHKVTAPGVLAEMIAEAYGGPIPDPRAVAKLAQEAGGYWKTYDLILAHQPDKFNGCAFDWLMGCLKTQRTQPKNGNGYHKPGELSYEELLAKADRDAARGYDY